MFKDLIIKKTNNKELTREEYYEIVDYLMKCGIDKCSVEIFLALDSFGMSEREVLYLTLAMRDSGRVLSFDQPIVEKHSTGGVGDASSLVLIPLLASLGYKVVKTTGKSFVFTNGSLDRFGAIPNFTANLSENKIKEAIEATNACVLSHSADVCPVDRILFDLRESCGIENNINLLAASIASKKLASGAKVVLVDVKYGIASLIKNYHDAMKLAHILRYIFNECGVQVVVAITNTSQTFGQGIGNAIELNDAIKVLKGEHCMLRDIVSKYAIEIIKKIDTRLNEMDLKELINVALDHGSAYQKFIDIVREQNGDCKAVINDRIFKPYKYVNFVAKRSGYVGNINSLLLGELTRRLCLDTHDNNIGVELKVKIGDYVKEGDTILTFYYKDDNDLKENANALTGCVRLTDVKIPKINPIKKILR